jgi:hypothetical protein
VSRTVTSRILAVWAVGVRGKDHFYVEAALGAGAGGEGGAVGVGDGADDGQAESVSFTVAGPLGAELPEWLEQVLDRVWRDEGAGVADRDGGARGGQCRRDLYLAARKVIVTATTSVQNRSEPMNGMRVPEGCPAWMAPG